MYTLKMLFLQGIPRFDCHYDFQSKKNQISNVEGTTKLNKDVAHFETYAKRKEAIIMIIYSILK